MEIPANYDIKKSGILQGSKFSVTFSYPHGNGIREEFVDSLTHLLLHETTKKKKVRILGSILKEGGPYVSMNRSLIVNHFLNYSQDSHLLMVDPDIAFKPNLLEEFARVVAANPDARIIAARVDLRNGLPVFYYQASDKVSNIHYCYPFNNIKEFDYVGTGIILLERNMLFDLYIKYQHTYFFNLIIEPETNRILGDDLSFCKLARESGYKVYGVWDIFGQHYKTFPVPRIYPMAESIIITKRG